MKFQDACARYVHRFTMEHIPSWAHNPMPNGRYYAPQYRSDAEWFELTLFPPHHPLGRKITDCYSQNETWPLGKSLATPYVRESR